MQSVSLFSHMQLLGLMQPVIGVLQAVYEAADERQLALQEQGEAMQVLLSDACQQQRKPAIAFVGATVQPDLSTTATSMVWPSSLPAFHCNS